jgi:hypothetical protein
VVAYHFEGDCLQNIVFEVSEVPVERVLDDEAAFRKRSQQTGWPRGWDPQKESPLQFLSRPGLKVFEIHCSYGMRGWIAAETLEGQVVPAPA